MHININANVLAVVSVYQKSMYIYSKYSMYVSTFMHVNVRMYVCMYVYAVVSASHLETNLDMRISSEPMQFLKWTISSSSILTFSSSCSCDPDLLEEEVAVLVLESLLWENSLFGDRAIAIRLHVSIISFSFSFFFDDEISLLPLHKISYIH